MYKHSWIHPITLTLTSLLVLSCSPELLLGKISPSSSSVSASKAPPVSPSAVTSSVNSLIVSSPSPATVTPKDSQGAAFPHGMTFVQIQPGTFTMGDDPNGPPHQVTLTKPFAIQTTELTQKQWEAVMGDNPSDFTGEDNLPVEKVSWNDAQEFIKKLNALGQGTYRLPTEAEWEYAARAGSTNAYTCGEKESCLGNLVWYVATSENKTHPVGQKPPNQLGLYDMYGNVWEWVEDGDADYPSGHVTDPKGPVSATERVIRGGSWSSSGDFLRSAARLHYKPDNSFNYLGFRLVQEK